MDDRVPRPLASPIRDDRVVVDQPPEVDRAHDQEQEDREDEGDLDERLSTGSTPHGWTVNVEVTAKVICLGMAGHVKNVLKHYVPVSATRSPTLTLAAAGLNTVPSARVH
jgi:hypothetical protein